jgi:hypothetical protein
MLSVTGPGAGTRWSGRRTVKRAPLAVFSTPIVPLAAFTIRIAVDSPMPVPLPKGFVVKKGRAGHHPEQDLPAGSDPFLRKRCLRVPGSRDGGDQSPAQRQGRRPGERARTAADPDLLRPIRERGAHRGGGCGRSVSPLSSTVQARQYLPLGRQLSAPSIATAGIRLEHSRFERNRSLGIPGTKIS